ncbi:type II toxin-antitoxin system RelE/ParE family toxin [soil metagenome]
MPKYIVLLTEDASADAMNAYDWYEEQQVGLGDSFYEHLLGAFDQLSQQPNSGRHIELGIRKILVFTFPYAIYYSVKEDAVRVLRVQYQGRHPDTWKQMK